jgi:hypothetical protein
MNDKFKIIAILLLLGLGIPLLLGSALGKLNTKCFVGRRWFYRRGGYTPSWRQI